MKNVKEYFFNKKHIYFRNLRYLTIDKIRINFNGEKGFGKINYNVIKNIWNKFKINDLIQIRGACNNDIKNNQIKGLFKIVDNIDEDIIINYDCVKRKNHNFENSKFTLKVLNKIDTKRIKLRQKYDCIKSYITPKKHGFFSIPKRANYRYTKIQNNEYLIFHFYPETSYPILINKNLIEENDSDYISMNPSFWVHTIGYDYDGDLGYLIEDWDYTKEYSNLLKIDNQNNINEIIYDVRELKNSYEGILSNHLSQNSIPIEIGSIYKIFDGKKLDNKLRIALFSLSMQKACVIDKKPESKFINNKKLINILDNLKL